MPKLPDPPAFIGVYLQDDGSSWCFVHELHEECGSPTGTAAMTSLLVHMENPPTAAPTVTPTTTPPTTAPTTTPTTTPTTQPTTEPTTGPGPTTPPTTPPTTQPTATSPPSIPERCLARASTALTRQAHKPGPH